MTLVVVALAAACGSAAGPVGGESADPKGAIRNRVSSRIHPEALGGHLIVGQIPLPAGFPREGAVTIPASDQPLPDGSRIISVDPAKPDSAIRNLTPGFVAAGRADGSFDGKRILFIGKRAPEDSFAVWEMNLDGGALRQVTHRAGDALQALYLSTLFLRHNDRPESRIAFLESGLPGGPASLYTCRGDGTDVMRITYNPHGVYDPLLLSDGRLLYGSRRERGQESGGDGGSVLFTVFPDGTDIFVFAGGDAIDEAFSGEPRIGRGMPCEMSDGRVVYVESPVARPGSGGMLVVVDRRRGLRTRKVVASDADGYYRSPKALRDDLLLVSHRPVDQDSYGVFLFDAATGRRVAKVFDDPAWHDVDAVAAMPRPVPAGRSSAVDPSGKIGWLYCLNAYESSLGGDGKEARIARVQVVVPDRGAEKLLGEAPVEADGSFFLELPAGSPVRLKTLDENGNVLQAMRSWIWVMPNEARGCIGCHEDRDLTPPNRHVQALRKRPTRIGMDRSTVPVEAGQGTPAGP